MDRRGHESPMDFQYSSGYGPTNPQSPFFSLTPSRQTQGNFSNQAFGRPDSPPKQPIFPSQQPAPAPNLYRAPSFTTPRKPPESFDFSSGPENNQSSPDMADNDETPPAKPSAPLMRFIGSKPEKKSLLNVTPGRGAIARINHDDRLSRKVHKRKRREYDRDNHVTPRRPSHDYDSDSRPNSSDGPNKLSRPHSIGIIPSIFTFIHQHPNLPHILSWYTQYMLNLFAVLFIMYLACSFWSTIRSDVDQASGRAAAETMAEMAVCAREYVENRCDGEYRVRAMETVCENWAKCMNQDPTLVGRARVSAHTFAEIFNSFIEPISYKAWIFCITMAVSLLAVSNIAFSFFRQKTPPLPPHSYVPSQHPMHQNVDQGFFTPYQNRMDIRDTPYQSRLGFQGGDHGMRMRTPSPSKRIGYR